MVSEVVKYAPKAVIEELDSFNSHVPNGLRNVFNLFGGDDLLDTIKGFDANIVTEWVYRTDVVGTSQMRELAVISHYLGVERLQPEREPRWGVYMNNYRINFMELDKEGNVMYPGEVTEKQARGYAELFGGEPKEIK